MIDIFNIPLYYISFKKNTSLENHLKENGFKNINHFQAIDGRKFKPLELLEKNMITIRTYNDLIYGREQHSGIPTLGGIGCTLSHRSLWKLCIDKNLPYITIVEEDAYFKKPLSEQDIVRINNALKKPNGYFNSTNIFNNGSQLMFLTHFQILTKIAAEELYKHSLPIDVQTDAYINNINNRGKISIEAFSVAEQNSHQSSIQTDCLKCWLPTNKKYYIYFLLVILSIIFIITCLYILKKKDLLKTILTLKKCEKSKSKCLSKVKSSRKI